MNELRWILLLVGVLLIAGVFFYTRWQQTRRQGDNTETARHEPQYEFISPNDAPEDEDGTDVSGVAPASETYPDSDLEYNFDSHPGDLDTNDTVDPASDPIVPHTEPVYPELDETTDQKILTVHIMAPEGSTFAAQEVVDALQAAGMKYGKFGIFHHDIPVGGAARTVFSAADMVEPGTFDLGKLDDSWLIGITLFMVLPGPRNGVDAFAHMLTVARQLAEKLDGEVVDSSHSSLTRQTAHHMREQIIAFEAKTH